MHAWLARHFGSVDAVRRQEIVQVTNLVSLDTALFSPLRARRPIDGAASRDGGGLAIQMMTAGDDPFCRPLEATPANVFGRIRGVRAMTGANAAAADAHHAVIVFDRHDPLAFDGETVADVLRVGRDWAAAARAQDREAVNYLLIWNCLWRAGASIVHGHAQVLLGRGRHHGALERLRRESAEYREQHGAGYVEDLVAVHRDLGLVRELDGVSVVASLTPAKERELLVVGSPGEDERDAHFSDALGRTLVAYRDVLGVQAFNLALLRPPLGGELEPGWRDLPPIVRLTDRGDPMSRSSDIGAVELLAGSAVVGCDPHDMMALLGPALEG